MKDDSPTSAPNVLFLGAGASRPLGKMLMGEFITHLQNIPEISGSALFHDIIGKNRDLEFLLEELQDIEQKGYLKYHLSDEHDNLYPPRPPPYPQRPERSFAELAISAGRLRRLIEEQVFLQYRGFDDDAQVKRLLEPLFERIAAATKAALVVFTTNYDLAVEKLCALSHKYECIDGFVDDLENRLYFWDKATFESDHAHFGRRPLFLFKLHGSVDWIRSGPRIVRGVPLFAAADKQHTNVMIYPATRKVSYEEPFFTCYNYLQDCLSNARYCLVVGYSFRDYDAITRIRAAVRKNPSLVIQILDPNASALVKELRRFEVEAKPIAAALQPGGVLPEIKPHSEGLRIVV